MGADEDDNEHGSNESIAELLLSHRVEGTRDSSLTLW